MRLHVYPLDAVRFFAAFSVLAFHLAFYSWAAPASTVGSMFEKAAPYPLLAPWTWFGWVGVEVFFVISGFVIANSANNASPMAFLKSRVLRLYPAAWICAFITLAAWLLIDGATWERLSGGFLHSVTLWVEGPWIDGVYWTLAVEMAFYALIFILLVSTRFSRLPWFACALTLYSAVFLAARLLFDAALPNMPWQMLIAHENLLLLRYGVFFAVGIFMWLSHVRPLRAWEWCVVGLGVIACCGEIYLRSAELAGEETHAAVTMAPIIPTALWLGILLLMFAFAQAPERFTPKSGRAKGLLEHLGKMTYPLYLTHSVVGAGIMRLLIEAGVHRWTALAMAASAMLLTASLIALAFEPAVRAMLRAVWSRVERALRLRALAFLFKSGGAVTPAG
ncbi:MAG TPA: acyltransferase [Candidatus Binatia bacterium]|nr:acyltransferase [Candidatus Binatia bacterium]